MKEGTSKISVRSIPKTFRRAGMKFTDTPQVFEDVNNKTLAVLQAEPMLVVEVLPEETDAGSKGGKK